jgi:hypothetical protein
MNIAIDTVKNSWYATLRDKKVSLLEDIRKHFLAHIIIPQNQEAQNALVKNFFDVVSTARDGREKMETKSKVAFMNALNQDSKDYFFKVIHKAPGSSAALEKNPENGLQAIDSPEVVNQLPPQKEHNNKKSVEAKNINCQNIVEAMGKAIGNRLQAFFKGEKYQALMAYQESMIKAKNKDDINEVLLNFIHKAAQPREMLIATAEYGNTHSCRTFFDNLDENNKQYVFEALEQGEEKNKSFENFVTIIAEYNSQPSLRPK